jgi:hypothetical protein
MAVRFSALCVNKLLPAWRFLQLTFVRDWVDLKAIVRLEELEQLRNPMTSSGTNPRPSRLKYECSASNKFAIAYALKIFTKLYECNRKEEMIRVVTSELPAGIWVPEVCWKQSTWQLPISGLTVWRTDWWCALVSLHLGFIYSASHAFFAAEIHVRLSVYIINLADFVDSFFTL